MGSVPKFESLTRAAKVFLVILGIALAIRLVVVGVTRDYELVTDAADYHRHAVSISNGDGYPETMLAGDGGPTAFRPPLYPYFISAVYTVTGPRWNAVRVIQAFLGVVIVALIGLIALRLWDRRVALVASGIAAVYPPLIISGAVLLGEILFLTLELGAIAAALQHRRSTHRYRWLVAAGILAGLASLTRSNGVVLLLPLLVACWPGRGAVSGRWLLQPATLLASALVVVAPWTVRNAVELDSFVPVATQSGYALAGTYNETSRTDPDEPGAWQPPRLLPEFRDLFGSSTDEVELDRELRSHAVEFIGEHPLYPAEVGVLNTLRVLDLSGLGYAERIAGYHAISAKVTALGAISFYVVGLMALIGAFTLAARAAPLFLWLTPVVFLLSVVMVSDSAGRYRVPLEPFVILLAALGTVALWRRLSSRGAPTTGPTREAA